MKNTYIFEFEINCPASVLYSFLIVPKSLKLWFADEVTTEGKDKFVFKWDGTLHIANLTETKLNQYACYTFTDEETKGKIEFTIDSNELTQTCFLKIKDSTSSDSEKDNLDVWKNIVHELKEALGDHHK